jgi:hypothetical protein
MNSRVCIFRGGLQGGPTATVLADTTSSPGLELMIKIAATRYRCSAEICIRLVINWGLRFWWRP